MGALVRRKTGSKDFNCHFPLAHIRLLCLAFTYPWRRLALRNWSMSVVMVGGWIFVMGCSVAGTKIIAGNFLGLAVHGEKWGKRTKSHTERSIRAIRVQLAEMESSDYLMRVLERMNKRLHLELMWLGRGVSGKLLARRYPATLIWKRCQHDCASAM